MEINKEDHKKRHIELHESLDELVSDFINHTESMPTETTVLDLLKWAYLQTINPDDKDEADSNNKKYRKGTLK